MHQQPNTTQQLAIEEATMILETLCGYQALINAFKKRLQQGQHIIPAAEVEKYIVPSRLDVLARRSYIPFEIRSIYFQGQKAYEIDGLIRAISHLLPLLRSTFYSKRDSRQNDLAQDLTNAGRLNSHQA